MNIERNTTLTITNINPESTINMFNNDIDNKVDAGVLGALGVSGAAIKNMAVEFTVNGSNNNTDNKVDVSALGVLGMAIKDMNVESIASKTNNNTDVEVDADKFIDGVISKTDVELTIGSLYKPDIIIEKEVYKSNLL